MKHIFLLLLFVFSVLSSKFNMTQAISRLMPYRVEEIYEQINQEVTFENNSLETIYSDIPQNFDSRDKFGSCIHPIRDQGSCGSCWAHATSEALSDRFCINSSGKINVTLSPQTLVSCNKNDTDKNHSNHGCNGGQALYSFRYCTDPGLLTDECIPYTSGKTSVDGVCSRTCVDPKADSYSYKCIKGTAKGYIKPEDIKRELMTNGPMYTLLNVYEDFMYYRSGIYTRTSNNFLGGHNIKLIGWGNANGVEYWTCANSWTQDWGENGFFRIGVRQAAIAYFAYACNTSSTKTYDNFPQLISN